MVPEGGTAKVACRARGMPEPRVLWRREDGADIVIRDPNGGKNKGEQNKYSVKLTQGEFADVMGSMTTIYLACIFGQNQQTKQK